MASVKENDRVSLAFTGKLDNGEIFAEASEDRPLQVRIGNNELPPSVETNIIGMQVGQSRKIRVSPEEGYGPRLKSLLHDVPRSNFGDRISLKPGMVLSQKVVSDGLERQVPVTVIEIKDDRVMLDYNHPLAGHHLTYDLTVISIDS